MTSKKVTGRYLAPCGLALLLMAGCASLPQQATPEQRVMQRAQERMDALVQGQLEEAYEYLSPGQRSSLSLRDFIRQEALRKVHRKGARVQSAECRESACSVVVEVDLLIVGAVPGVRMYDKTVSYDEQWVLADGEWWYVPE